MQVPVWEQLSMDHFDLCYDGDHSDLLFVVPKRAFTCTPCCRILILSVFVPPYKKTNTMHMQNQRCRSAVQ